MVRGGPSGSYPSRKVRGEGAVSALVAGVRLRRIADADLGVLYEHQRDPVAVAMAGSPTRDRRAFEVHWRGILSDPGKVVRIVDVENQNAGYVVGFRQDTQWVIGYWIGRAWWGRGLAAEAVSLFLREVPYRPVFAYVAPHNLRSMRVLEKVGFQLAPRDLEADDVLFIYI
jgi:RimJ/RimL family protein N-acetyltransferase